jgi:hypothetical protein
MSGRTATSVPWRKAEHLSKRAPEFGLPVVKFERGCQRFHA